jgi:hypothetical protein
MTRTDSGHIYRYSQGFEAVPDCTRTPEFRLFGKHWNHQNLPGLTVTCIKCILMDNQYFQCLPSVIGRFVSFQQKCTKNKQKRCFLCYEKENVFTKGKARMRFAQRMRLSIGLTSGALLFGILKSRENKIFLTFFANCKHLMSRR